MNSLLHIDKTVERTTDGSSSHKISCYYVLLICEHLRHEAGGPRLRVPVPVL